MRYETVTAQVEPLFADFRGWLCKDAQTAVPRFCWCWGRRGAARARWRSTWPGVWRMGCSGGRPARAAGPGAAAGMGGLDSQVADSGLPEYLTAVHQDLRPAPSTGQWREWLVRGDVLLLLDGVDEAAGSVSFGAALKKTLDLFPQCPAVLTVPHGELRAAQGGLSRVPGLHPGGAGRRRARPGIFAYPAQHPEHFDAAGLIRQVQAAPLPPSRWRRTRCC